MLNTLLLQATEAAQAAQEGAAEPGAGAGITNLLFIVGIIVVFYFFMIRPQKKQQQKIEEERNNMKVGDNVITNGGLYGKIDGINTTTDKKGNSVAESFIIKLKPEYQVRIQVSKDCVFKDLSDLNATQGK
ncbi:MAG: preprotein translocase subunit YajC [Bacteroidales bacterium]|nr:preprotein translocase subunit YajC [Bacteroidales bacterium]